MPERQELSLYEQDLRKWACGLTGGDVGDALVVVDFVMGRTDRTPLEKITDALREAGVK